MTAAAIGVEPHIVRQWLGKQLFGESVRGERQGRERRLDVGEATLLRLLAEHLPSTGSLRESWAAVAGLAHEIDREAQEDPPFPLDMFAIEAWSGLGPAKQGERLVCIGKNNLARCIAEQTVQGRTRINFINISNVLAEVITGWDIAALGAEEARLEFEKVYLSRLPVEQRARALAMFEELEKRIAGTRPAATEPGTSWATWSPPANAA